MRHCILRRSAIGAELTKQTETPESSWDASYFVPVFADLKYSFTKTLASPFVSLRGGAIADITNLGVRTFASEAVYQLGFWGHLDGKHIHNVKLGVAYTF